MTIEELLAKLEERLARDESVVYDIMKRRAGWGIMIHEKDRQERDNDNYWKTGLVTYAYYPTLREALEGDLKRLGD